ncbi:TIGR03621 family F420-dependent LLM class oxidoreductase [Rhodococcus spongiicola]|uniref:TIGR03621 family F420-dependent LLM class oxidoreductase n=1 Tax=Rhodococcus spongiicola TaxID=2487352 RepID=A0A3S3AD10_9NOCA|nr:TIGR03621 family F420-dependent LLM class oxidoreductase [Rhodococcus spongiicola]RVW01632.1 TIGR03621 family F420-dependent LLM class oxidoreductase [Rhodococcus spongiicola]
MTEFRFSQNIFGLTTSDAFAQACRRAEQGGYDAVFAADHLGTASPFPLLVAAAAVTDRLRVGTLVLNIGFWNPALLAREIATVDILTGGRLEIGLGVGHMKWEFDEAGTTWEPFGTRVRRLTETVDALRNQFAADGYPQQAALHENYGIPVLRPVQRVGFAGTGPPLLIGGTGERVLQLAGRVADIVGVAGTVQLPGQPPGTMRLATAAEADERILFTREQAGRRAAQLEWQALVQAVIETDDRSAAATELAAGFGGVMSPQDLLDTPFALLGTVDEMARQILANRERYGFTHYTVHEPNAAAFASVISRVRALQR